MSISYPAATHWRRCSSARFITYCVSGRIKPVRSATGMNSSGFRYTLPLRSQRTSISARWTSPDSRSSCGCANTARSSTSSAPRNSCASTSWRGVSGSSPGMNMLTRACRARAERKRDLRPAQQVCGGRAVVGMQRDADARAELDDQTRDVERLLLERPHDEIGRAGSGADAARVGKQQCELVAAEASRNRRSGCQLPQAGTRPRGARRRRGRGRASR